MVSGWWFGIRFGKLNELAQVPEPVEGMLERT
jgi:hypothetical protein